MLDKNNIQDILKKLNQYKATLSKDDLFKMKKVTFCIEVIERIDMNYDDWMLNCPFSNKTVSSYVSERYIKIDGISDEFYLSCARFLREYVLALERKGYKDVWIYGDWSLFITDSKNIVQADHEHFLDYLLSGKFDIDVLNHYLGDRSFQAFLNYEDNVLKLEESNKQIETNVKARTSRLENFLEEKEKQVNQLAETLKEQKIAFNFVGLSKGFSGLLEDKKESARVVLLLLFVMAIFLFCPLLIYMGIPPFACIFKIQSGEPFDLMHLLPFLSIELISLYLFRVVLGHYNSIKAQIMQLELRLTLCQFIQSYTEYVKEMKGNDEASLEKFESVIFSSILSNSEKVPSTFDGLEQLANFIKEIRK